MTRYPLVLKAIVGIIFMVVFAGMSPLCRAATYYVDATNGNDSNNGTSTLTAWKTISKVNVSTFSPGDKILFKRGEAWREKLDVPSSGASDNHVVFGAYGNGSAPLFLGSKDYDDASLWTETAAGSHKWKTADGTFSSAGQVYYNTNGVIAAAKEVEKESDLGSNWEFWFDSLGDKVVLYLEGGDPASQADGLEITSEDTGSDGRIEVYNKHYITIENLEVKYGNSMGIMNWESHHITINSCTVNYCGGHGGYGPGQIGAGITAQENAHDISITNCTVSEIYDDGIACEAFHPNGRIYNIEFFNNTVFNCGQFNIDIAILSNATNTQFSTITISGNTLYDGGKGLLGITANTPYPRGIYINNNVSGGSSSVSDVTIKGNHIYGFDIISNATGIEIDSISSVVITNNKIGGCAREGIYVKGPSSGEIVGNVILDSKRNGILLWSDVSGPFSIYNNTLLNNGNTYDPAANIRCYGTNSTGCDNVTIMNNILVSSSSGQNSASVLMVAGPGTINLNHNCYYGEGATLLRWKGTSYTKDQFAAYQLASGNDANSIAQDPYLKDPANGDFSLKKDSPCRDTGTPVGITRDISGTTIPQGSQVDMGAYEFTVNPPPAKPKNLRISGYVPVYGKKQ